MTGTMHPAMTLPVRPATCGDVRATVLDWSERRPHAVDALFSAIGDALAKGEPVSITGFGTFSVKSRPARQSRNPRTGEAIEIAASRVPSFKPGKRLRDAVG